LANLFSRRKYPRLWKLISLFQKGDLRIRYIIALSLIAFLIIVEQVIVQISLNDQITGLSFIQSSRLDSAKISSLRRKLLEIQAYTNQKKAEGDFQKLSVEIDSLFQKEKKLWLNANLKSDQGLTLSSVQLKHLRTRIFTELNSLNSPQKDMESFSLSILELSSLLEDYVLKSEELTNVYDKELKQKLNSFRIVELVLVGTILSALLFEAFFIFAPAISKLDHALQARSSFFSRIGHEIRNPMNSILGMADLLEKQMVDENQILYIRRLKRSASGLLSFLNNVIEFAGIENKKRPVSLSEVNLSDLVEELSSLFFLEVASKKLNFYFNFSKTTPNIFITDFIKLKYILINLLSNAVKFTDRGDISVSFNYLDGELYLAVEDTGVGISPDKHKDVFHEFVQEDSSTRRKYGGTGLGLSIVKDYVQQLNGVIELDSQKGEGCRFKVRLPVTAPEGGVLSLKSTHDLYVVKDKKLYSWAKEHFFGDVYFVEDHQNLNREFKNKKDQIVLSPHFHTSLELISEINFVFVTELLREGDHKNKIKSLFPIVPMTIYNATQTISKSYEVDSLHKLDKKILVCDDSIDNRVILINYLRLYFESVDQVENGEQCLDILKVKKFDYVFLDIQMPDLDGYEVISSALKFVPESTHFIAFTAHDGAQEVSRMNHSGFTHILNKPISERSIKELLGKLSITVKPQNDDFEMRVKKRLLKKRDDFLKDKSQRSS
jgi:signal transduction histidine kinase/FixJ family two-component response regulator